MLSNNLRGGTPSVDAKIPKLSGDEFKCNGVCLSFPLWTNNSNLLLCARRFHKTGKGNPS